MELLNHYTGKLGTADNYTEQATQEINTFLDNLLATKQGLYLIDYLKTNHDFTTTEAIKERLYQAWFEIFDRQSNGVKDSCGFEHVFVGELSSSGQKVGGFHNWLRFYQEEQDGDINYYGYTAQKTTTPHIITLQYTFDNAMKKVGSFFLGNDPYTEFCLFTIAYFHDGNTVPFNIDAETRIEIKNYNYLIDGKNYISTTYPVDVSSSLTN